MKYEYIYILTNDCMPDWVKVGKTKNIKERLKNLYSTSVPLPFECFAFLAVPPEYTSQVENSLHSLLGISFSQKKEFFKTTPDSVLNVFKQAVRFNKLFKLVEHPNLGEEKQSNQTTFKLLNIPINSTLYYISDPSITCTTYNGINKVLYQGELYSISTLGRKLKGYNVNGYTCFYYDNNKENLTKRRERLYK